MEASAAPSSKRSLPVHSTRLPRVAQRPSLAFMGADYESARDVLVRDEDARAAFSANPGGWTRCHVLTEEVAFHATAADVLPGAAAWAPGTAARPAIVLVAGQSFCSLQVILINCVVSSYSNVQEGVSIQSAIYGRAREGTIREGALAHEGAL